MSQALPSVFISYNPNSDFEETLAIRLHTIGAVHGYNTLLPDRTNNQSEVTANTKQRINMADYFILFSTTPKLSSTVAEEIRLAYLRFHDKSKIITVFDAKQGRNLKGLEHCTAIFIDSATQGTTQVLEKILEAVKKKDAKSSLIVPPVTDNSNVLAGILLAGLGLLLLGALLGDNKK
jgi:hypothetical protein